MVTGKIVAESRRILWVCLAIFAIFGSSGCQWASSGQNAQGVRLYEQGQFSAAMQQFQQSISSNPANPDSYYNLAATTHRLGVQRNDTRLIEQAESLYNQCLDIAPNHIECHRGLAVLLMESNRPDKAFALVKNWVTTQPNLSDARVELARLYQEAGEPQQAQKYLEDAVQRDPSNPRGWLALAQLRESAGDLQQALTNYQRSYSINSGQPAVLQRISALNRQISSGIDASHHGNSSGTLLAQPGPAKPRY